MMKVPIINKSSNDAPAYATPGAAGMDVRADIIIPVTLQPLERKVIPTGIHIGLPEGYECQVRPRSGLALKHGITVLNAPGTIDADYRGEVGVILINLSNTPYTIEPGERIAQLVFAKCEQVQLTVVKELDATDRADGGFGHSGKK